MAQGRGCALLSLVGCVALLAAACATPVGAVRVEPDVVHRTLTGSVLSVGTPSIPTQNVLHEQNLAERFDEEPEAALADLHAAVVSGRRGVSALFALSELSFFHAERTHKRAYYLAAAVYAYAFLFSRTMSRPIPTPSIRGSGWLPTSTTAASPGRWRRRTEPTSISVQESSLCRLASCTFRSTVTI